MIRQVVPVEESTAEHTQGAGVSDPGVVSVVTTEPEHPAHVDIAGSNSNTTQPVSEEEEVCSLD